MQCSGCSFGDLFHSGEGGSKDSREVIEDEICGKDVKTSGMEN